MEGKIKFLIISILVSLLCGLLAGFGAVYISLKSLDSSSLFSPLNLAAVKESPSKVVRMEEESATVEAVDKVSPAVVSIIVTKDLPAIERRPFFNDPFFRHFFGDDLEGNIEDDQGETQKREIGGGTGFIVSKDGYVVTNKHVVRDEEAEYTVLMNNEEKYKAEVIDRDPSSDLAYLKIEIQKDKDFPFVELGDSSNLKPGQKVIAIGNALGEFRNTVSTGVISGLARSITAGGLGAKSEKLMDVIQTDASINPGNSGGPLLNIDGQVIGINTAMAQGAENIGFAIPVNEIKDSLEDIKKEGKIIRPWLGVRYVLINDQIVKSNNLEVDHGALIIRGQSFTDLAVVPGSPADKAGLQENDIILEVNGEKINRDNPLVRVISEYNPGEKIKLKIWRQGEEELIKAELGEMK